MAFFHINVLWLSLRTLTMMIKFFEGLYDLSHGCIMDLFLMTAILGIFNFSVQLSVTNSITQQSKNTATDIFDKKKD